MEMKRIGKIVSGQDGAIFGGFLFRLDHRGNCTVYKLAEISEESVPYAKFTLGSADILAPHSKTVRFFTLHILTGGYFLDNIFSVLYNYLNSRLIR